jgi:N6-L-threonylcarbamoyladenine synthase
MTHYILGIESSCDDTGVAIVSSNKRILSNIVVSQLKEHAPYLGVVPEVAARSHMRNLEAAVKKALLEAQMSLQDLDAIAVTAGPGLIGGVIVGTMFAKGLASAAKKPFIAINHLEGHVLTTRLTSDVTFPYLSLLVSGGHCQFIAVLGIGKYKILGETLDDAVGEAFDKTAKILGLGFPGGPIIEKLAMLGKHDAYILPLSMTDRSGCDMSFSGLKTAVRRIVEEEQNLSEEFIRNICASFQYTASEILSRRSINAIKMFEKMDHPTNVKHFILSGGVAANMYLRQKLQYTVSTHGFNLIAPEISLCTDNAAMIAWAGCERLQLGIVNDLSFCPKARWSLEDLTNANAGTHGNHKSK